MTSTMSSDLETLEITAFASLFACTSSLLKNGISVLFSFITNRCNFPTFRYNFLTFIYKIAASWCNFL